MLIEIVVQEGTNRVMSRSDGMEIAGEVQVDFLHRQHLGIATACSTALHAKAGAERWLTQGYGSLLAYLIQAHSQTYTDGGLTNTHLRRTDGCNQNQTTFLNSLFIDERHGHLRHKASVGLHLLRCYAQLFCNVTNRSQLTFASNLNVCLHI